MIEIIAAQYIVLKTPDGRTVHVNPKQVVSTSQSTGKLLSENVRCVIYTTDGRFISVVETCEDIKARLEELK